MLTVGSIMTRKVITVSPESLLQGAHTLLVEHGLRHVLVMERGRVIGVLSERDLEPRAPSQPEGGECRTTVRDRMSICLETVSADESVSRACRRMLERRISCLPVVEAGQLAGILTEFDLLRLFERVCRYSGQDPAVDPRIEERGAMVVVGPDDTVADALDLSRAKGIRHLPVLRDGWLVGVLSDRDLMPVAGRGEGASKRVGELMTRDFVAVEPGTPLSVAAECMVANGFHSLPVLVQGALRGIVTSADVLAALCAIDEQALAAAWSGEARLAAGVEES